MKKITVLLLTLVLGLNLSVFAGGDKDGFVGTIKYKVSAEGRELTAQELMGMPTEIIESFYGDLSRKEIVTPMSSTIIITDKAKKEMILLLDIQGQKMYVKKTMKDEKEEADTTDAKSQPKLLSGTKTVAGYTCKKAKYSQEGLSVTVYYSEDIKVESDDFEGLSGYPLYYEMDVPNDDELSLVYKATEVIKKKPKKKLFKIPSDYEEMPEEMQKQFGLNK